MFHFNRAIVAALTLAFSFPLSACSSSSNFDPTDLIPSGWFSNKTPLPGERREVFPGGVPGVAQGVPPEMMKGRQQATEETPPAVEAASAPPAKPAAQAARPRPRTAARAPQPQPAAAVARPSAQSSPSESPWPDAAPAPKPAPSGQSAASPWPDPNPAPKPAASPWPDPPAKNSWPPPNPNTFSR